MNSFQIKLFLVVAAAGEILAYDCRAADAGKPNIVFILADDLGLPALGCTGGVYQTPHLDALAQGGTRFENCFAAPLCGPSRAMLMTGRYAFRTGVRDNGLGAQATPDKDGCVALQLKQAGYATAVAGKWRQLSHFRTKEDGVKWGFDEFLIWGAGEPNDESAASRAERKAKRAGGENNTKGERYWNPEYNLNGRQMPNTESKYGPDLLHAFVVDFIQRHTSQPFFVYYPMPLIHGPILATPDSKQPGTAKSREGRKQSAKVAANSGEGSLYVDNIAYLDKLIGKLVAELDALKLREKTLIVFAGDNGSVPIGTVHGRAVDGKKANLLEGGSRVPLIANWSGTTPGGKVLKDLVDFSDMLPTFCELAGTTAAPGRTIDGHSFAPQLRGESGQPREWAYVHLGNQRYVRSQRWKLTGDGELFDMQDAPYRQIPVAADSQDSEAQTARGNLQKVLTSLIEQDTDSSAPVRKRRAKKNAAGTP
jgi:arylsulfatase A